MRLRDVLLSAVLGATFLASYLKNVSALPIPQDATLYLHIKHALPYPYTLGKVQSIYNQMQRANKTGLNMGVQPQCTADWATQKAYYVECGKIPVMFTVFASDESYQLSLEQIQEIIDVCNVKWLRFHEVLSYFTQFPTDYAKSVLALAKERGIPVFWSEWDVNMYPTLASIISGYEDNVAVSFGTNNNWLEPAQGYALLQQFQRRGASVQSWYWWERNNRQDGYEFTMPTQLMFQHTQEAFSAGCEVVQFEPFGYFFNAEFPKITLPEVFSKPF